MLTTFGREIGLAKYIKIAIVLLLGVAAYLYFVGGYRLPSFFSESLEEVLERTKSDVEEERLNAILSLANFPDDLDKTVPVACKFSVSSKDVDRIAASFALKEMGAPLLDHIDGLLNSENPIDVNAACNGIAETGEAGVAKIDRLIELVKSDDPNLVFCGCKGLERMGPPALPALPHVVKLLEHKSFNVQIRACNVIATIGAKAEPALDAVVKLSEEGIASASSKAAIALGAIGTSSDDPRILEQLGKKLDAFGAIQRERSLTAIAQMGERAKPLLEKVTELMNNEDKSVMPEAALAYFRITGDQETTKKVLEKYGQDATYETRVLEVIYQLKADAGFMLEFLTERLEKGEVGSQEVVLDALYEIGPKAKPSANAIRRISNSHEDPLIRYRAKQVLEAIKGE